MSEQYAINRCGHGHGPLLRLRAQLLSVTESPGYSSPRVDTSVKGDV